jgi:hypothetical protein
LENTTPIDGRARIADKPSDIFMSDRVKKIEVPPSCPALMGCVPDERFQVRESFASSKSFKEAQGAPSILICQ